MQKVIGRFDCIQLRNLIFSRTKSAVAASPHFSVSCFTTGTSDSSNMNPVILKSPNDTNLYKAITLKNGLKALLISDPRVSTADNAEPSPSAEDDSGQESADEVSDGTFSDDGSSDGDDKQRTKMAAAALCIGVGSFSDPPELQGLAHFLEHMVFMGSERYPDENAYDSYISKHGGSNNAATDCERTVFQLDVTPQHFKEALTIFSHCFILPLLKADTMNREIEAVDGEFELAAPIDSERLLMLLRTMTKSGHPMSHFVYGNKVSLKTLPAKKNIDVNGALRHFYKRYYSASQMTLAVQSSHSLETLEKWVKDIFSLIPNNGLSGPSFESLQRPFKSEKFNRLYKVMPVKKMHQISMTWALPPVVRFYKIKPLSYLGWLVGHEGKGSIIAYLRKKSWAVTLEAGNDGNGYDMNTTCSLFNVTVCLTESGMNHVFEVITVVLQYLKMLRLEGPKEYIFNEIKTVRDREFQFQEQREPIDNVEAIAENMQLFPCEHYLAGDALYFEYNDKVISNCLHELTHSEVNICVLSNRYAEESEKWKVEQWMQCKYKSSAIPSEWMKKWKDLDLNPELHLPESNRYIATDFDLKNAEEPENEYPVKVFEDEQSRLWFMEDAKFKVPRAYAYFHVISPLCHKSPLNSSMMDLFCALLNQVLCEDTYPAELASIYYHVYYSFEGFIIQVYGFNEKLILLLETVLEGIAKFDASEEMFCGVKKHVSEGQYNRMIKPYKLRRDIEMFIQQNVFWTSLEKNRELDAVTLEQLKSFIRECLSDVFIETLIQGNITKQEAVTLNTMVVEKLKVHPLDLHNFPDLKTMKLLEGDVFCRVASFNKEDHNSVISNYYQLGLGSIEIVCKLELLMEFMNEPCFDALRTRGKLGYDVSSSLKIHCGVLGFSITVHTPSNKYSCSYVDEQIEIFLAKFLEETKKIGADEYFTQLESLIQCKKCEDLRLKEEVDRNWMEILNHNHIFDRRKKEIECLEKLDMHDFMEWLKSEPFSGKRKKLGMQVVGPTEVKQLTGKPVKLGTTADKGKIKLQYIIGEPEDIFISDIDEFKGNLEAFPQHKIT